MSRTVRKFAAVAAVGGVVLGSLALAPGAVGAPGETKAIYVVETAPGSSNTDAEQAIIAAGGSIKARWNRALQGFAAEMPAGQAAGLAHNPHIASVTPDAEVTAFESLPANPQLNPPSWGLDRIDQDGGTLDKSYRHDTDGAGVHVYIIDTGIDPQRTDQFGDRIATDGVNFADTPNLYPGEPVWGDCAGHGTHVAGTVGSASYGVAKSVILHSVRVLGCDGSGSYSGVISGIEWVMNNKAANVVVANMSLGGGYYAPVNQAVENAVAAGVVMAIAAGNNNRNACNYSPASALSALTVGATTTSDSRASYSNYGSCLDLFAPGSGITSTLPGVGNEASWNGTSMATPHVAGVAARFLGANSGKTAAQVITAVLSSSLSGKVSSAGTGSPNKLLNSQFLDAVSNSSPSVSISSPTNGTSVAEGDVVNLAATATDAEDGNVTNSITWTVDGQTATSPWLATGVGVHTLTATARDSKGLTGANSVTINVTSTTPPRIDAPGVPPITSVVGSRGAVTLSWSAPSDGGAAIDGFEVALKTSSSKPSAGTPVGATATTYKWTGLPRRTYYYAFVRAHNSEGWGDWAVSGRVRTS